MLVRGDRNVARYANMRKAERKARVPNEKMPALATGLRAASLGGGDRFEGLRCRATPAATRRRGARASTIPAHRVERIGSNKGRRGRSAVSRHRTDRSR